MAETHRAHRLRIVFALIALLSSHAYSQFLYLGVKGGTPVSDSSASTVVGDRRGFGIATLNVRRYTIGPTMEVAIPFGFRFEADALYTRLDTTEHRFLSPSFGNINRLAANAWEFPLLLKYSWRHGRYRPFAAAGGTFRRIQSFEASIEMFAGGLQPPRSLFPLPDRGAASTGRNGIRLWCADQRRAPEGDSRSSIHEMDIA